MAFEAVASDDVRQLTALAIADTRADVVCLQEVDSQQALDVFYDNYLHPVLRQRFAQATKGWSDDERRAGDARLFLRSSPRAHRQRHARHRCRPVVARARDRADRTPG